MREGWQCVTLGDALREIHRPVLVANLDEVHYAGVRWYAEGVYVREAVPASNVKAKSLTELRSGDVTYNRMWATKASFGVAHDDVDGCLVTNDFPIFSVNPATTLVRFVELLFQTSGFQAEAAARAIGTTERRRLKQRDFLMIPVTLPSIATQRRIVDLIAAIDDAIASADAEAKASAEAEMAIAQAVQGVPTELRLLLSRIEAGSSPRALDRPPLGGERGVLKVSAIGYSGFKPSESKALPDSTTMPERALVRSGDLLMTRASGTVDRVGITCLVSASTDNLYLSDKTLRLVPDTSRTSADWLNTMLRTDSARRQIAALATGSDMRNLSQEKARQISLPTPRPDVQIKQAAAFSQFHAAADAARATAEALLALRSNLLTVLLSGEHEIPSSYDQFLNLDEEAAA